MRCSIKVDWLPGSRAREEASEQYVQRVSEIEGKNQNADDVAKQNADDTASSSRLKDQTIFNSYFFRWFSLPSMPRSMS